jgi:hypothetical protein
LPAKWIAQAVRGAASPALGEIGGVDLQSSLFTRVAATEAELRALEDILADVLDILAEVKANQDESRRNPDAAGGAAKRPATDQRRTWRQRLGALFLFRRPRFPGRRRKSVPDRATEDEMAFWKITGRIAAVCLALVTVFLIGLYHLLNS